MVDRWLVCIFILILGPKYQKLQRTTKVVFDNTNPDLNPNHRHMGNGRTSKKTTENDFIFL